jgi:hypothetical protein
MKTGHNAKLFYTDSTGKEFEMDFNSIEIENDVHIHREYIEEIKNLPSINFSIQMDMADAGKTVIYEMITDLYIPRLTIPESRLSPLLVRWIFVAAFVFTLLFFIAIGN